MTPARVKSKNSYDVIVIGAGHNGLVAANYIADAEKRVLVIERRGIPGGACSNGPVFPGFRNSIAASWFGMMNTTIIDALGLEHYGVIGTAAEPQILSLSPEGNHFILWSDRS